VETAIPIICGDVEYNEIEVTRPDGGVIADSNKLLNEKKYYDAMKVFLSGCITTLMDSEGNIIEDKKRIKLISGSIPFKVVEDCIIEIAKCMNPDDDGVEGIYQCPMSGCGHKIKAELTDEDDTRDFLSDMKYIVYDENNDDRKELKIQFDPHVEILDESTKKVHQTIDSIVMRHPTLDDCIRASSKEGFFDEARLQYRIFIEAITKVNGEEIEKKWKTRNGMSMFLSVKNIRNISDITARTSSGFGYDASVEKICPSCGKRFSVEVDTASFFYSALK
jgi:hypothetical protein